MHNMYNMKYIFLQVTCDYGEPKFISVTKKTTSDYENYNKIETGEKRPFLFL